MKTCAVSSCTNDASRHPELSFFSLPRDSYVRDEWCEVLGKTRTTDWAGHIKVCEVHFRTKDFCAGKKQLKTHAVPVLKLGLGKLDPVNSEDEFMQCGSDSDPEILEVKKLSVSDRSFQNSALKVKQEPVEDQAELKQEPETTATEADTGRRPSRRAARVAAKKISNSVRSFGLGEADIDQASTRSSQGQPKVQVSPRPYHRHKQKQKDWHPVRIPPAKIDLVMECHEELLSAVQAEALLKAQLEYNMVMKTLRSLRANNVRIICSLGDEVDSEKPASPLPVLNPTSGKSDSPSSPGGKKLPNIITLTPVRAAEILNSNGVVPVELSAASESPSPPILA